jgi:hypothetical protein
MARPVVVNVIWDAETKSGSRRATAFRGLPSAATRWRNSLKSSRLPYLNCSLRMAFLSALRDCFSQSRRNAPNMRMLLPDGRKLQASRQSHSSRLERQLFSAFGMDETGIAHALRTSGATASSASPASASSRPTTFCSWLPSRRIDTVRFSASFLPTTSSTGTLARECSRTL